MSRISPGTLLLGIVAILFGLLGAYAVRLQMLPKPVAEVPAEEPPGLKLVPMASTDLVAGRMITRGDIALVQLLPEEVKQLKGHFMNRSDQIIGRVLNQDLPKGSTFNMDLLYPEGVFPNPADRLQSGFRAVTVNVEGPAAVAGFARPGAWVDVIFRADKNESEDLPEMTVTLVEAVEVLALEEQTFTGAKADSGRNSDPEMAVTLAVRPEQASALRVVDGRGRLSLVLRNPNDDSPTAHSHPRTLHDVLDRPYTRWRMEVYRGGNLSSVDFRKNERRAPTAEEIVDAENASKVAVKPADETKKVAGEE